MKLNEYKIIDNFLSIDDYNFILKNTIYNDFFNLYLNHGVAFRNKSKDGIFFTHNFVYNKKITSDFFNVLSPIIEKIKIKELIRIQLNLYPKTTFVNKHEWHNDLDYSHQGLIYYLNTNNGYTILKNNFFNTKIKSIKNRALFFDPSKEHKSTTCTNSNFRSNIIFNYL